jgi:hypothetical protein
MHNLEFPLGKGLHAPLPIFQHFGPFRTPEHRLLGALEAFQACLRTEKG